MCPSSTLATALPHGCLSNKKKKRDRRPFWYVLAKTYAKCGYWPGFTFSFLKKISVTTGNGIPAEISRFSGNFDRKEFSNSKFRNFGIPAGFSVHLAGFSVLFTEKWWKQLENDGEIMYLWKEIENFGEFALIMSIFIDYNTQHIRNSSTQWEIRKWNT